MMEKTPWFDARVKPVRDGEYEVKRLIWNYRWRKFYLSYHRLEFRRGNWYYTERSRMAYTGCIATMPHDNVSKWRGLASDPNGGKA